VKYYHLARSIAEAAKDFADLLEKDVEKAPRVSSGSLFVLCGQIW